MEEIVKNIRGVGGWYQTGAQLIGLNAAPSDTLRYTEEASPSQND